MQPFREELAPPRRLFLAVTVLYLTITVLAGTEAIPGLHPRMITFLVVLLLFVAARQVSFLLFALRERAPAPFDEERDTPPLVSVLVPAYNESAVIEASLRSLMALRYRNLEIIVIDDGSTDGTAERARSVSAESPVAVTVISQGNGGKAAALNTGLAHARGDLILTVDADSKVDPDALIYGVGYFADPAVGGVGGFVAIANRRSLLAKFQELEYLYSLNFARRALSRFGIVNVVPGPIGLFRREALLAVGGYAEGRVTFAEDADLTVRLLAAGWRVRGDRHMVSSTEAPETLFALLRQRYRWRRGLYQAFSDNFVPLVASRRWTGPPLALLIAVESFGLEVLNFGFTTFFIAHVLAFAEVKLMFSWYLVVVSADLAVFWFAIGSFRRFAASVPMFLLQRFTYSFLLQAWAVASLIDEWRASSMSWDKLERTGRLGEPAA